MINLKNIIVSKLVTTVKGESVLRDDARYISGEFYKIGDNKIENSGDCYLIDGKYYRFDTGYIIFDNRIGEYCIFNQNTFIQKGVIGFEGTKPIFGGFSIPDQITNLVRVVIGGETFYMINEEIMENVTEYLEDLNSGLYYHRKDIDSFRFVEPVPCSRDYKQSLPYDCNNIIYKATKDFEKHSKDMKISKEVQSYAKDLKGLTFGMEFETNLGTIPSRICNKLGLMPLRDGSINGLEFVTIPLEGEKGVQTIINSLKELKKRTRYDEDCSVHLHIGNVPRTEEFILALFKVLCFIQDDIFELFPLYKKYNFGYKKKHYTKPFPLNETLNLMDPIITSKNIKSNFNTLFEYISMGIGYAKYDYNLDNVHAHPSDPNGTSKWQIKTRYMAHNIIPLIFGNKKTIEFRVHTPTFDTNKVINFLFICANIINYTKENQKKILEDPKTLRNLNLSNIMYGLNINGDLVDNLSNYIQDRKRFVYNKNSHQGIHFKEDEYVPNNNIIEWGGRKIPKKLSEMASARASIGINPPELTRVFGGELGNYHANRGGIQGEIGREEVREAMRAVMFERNNAEVAPDVPNNNEPWR